MTSEHIYMLKKKRKRKKTLEKEKSKKQAREEKLTDKSPTEGPGDRCGGFKIYPQILCYSFF